MVRDWLVVFVGCVGWAGAACVLCSAHFQKFVYWVGVMFVHVMSTQCVVVWLQRMDVWDFVFMYWLHKAHCHLLPGPGFRSTSPLRSSRATSQPAGAGGWAPKKRRIWASLSGGRVKEWWFAFPFGRGTPTAHRPPHLEPFSRRLPERQTLQVGRDEAWGFLGPNGAFPSRPYKSISVLRC